MTDANYIRHLKVLGKYCKLYDNATADITAQNLLLSTTCDQVATGLSVDLPAVLLQAGISQQWSGNIVNGATALQSTAINAASQYLTLALFRDSMTTVPASVTAAAVITAFVTELGETTTAWLSTETTSGLANFFDVISGAEQTWPGSGTNQYLDATYVVSTIV
jgi:hypothetical protein